METTVKHPSPTAESTPAVLLGSAAVAVWFAPLVTTGSLAGYGLTGLVIQSLLTVLLLSGSFGLEVLGQTEPGNRSADRGSTRPSSRLQRRLKIRQRSAAPAANSAATTGVGTNAGHCQAG